MLDAAICPFSCCRSALTAQPAAANSTPLLGKAQRVPSPTKQPRGTATKEVRALMADLSLEDREGQQGRGTLAMLSPVRTHGHLRAQLGVDKVSGVDEGDGAYMQGECLGLGGCSANHWASRQGCGQWQFFLRGRTALRQVGAPVQVVTPVRRSVRNQTPHAALPDMLQMTNFSYGERLLS